MKNSYITITDQFCGAGGSSQGATAAIQKRYGPTGGQIKLALNHWELAIETHNTNFPDTQHVCTDIQACDPRWYPSTDILITSPECFPAGTLILTERGLVNIEEIKEGDKVLTHKNRWRKVTSTMTKTNDTIIIKGHGHGYMEVTGEHPFYVVGQRNKWNKSKYNGNGGYDRVFDDPTWVTSNDLIVKHLTSSHSDYFRHRWATPSNIPEMEVPEIKGKNNRWVDFNNEFWWMVGRWLGDGSLRIREGKHKNVVTICCGKHEHAELRERLQFAEKSGKHAKRNEIHWSEREIRTSWLFEATHESLGTWLLEHFGKGAHYKTLPSWIYGMKKEWRTSLLAGYVSADGSVNERYVMTSSVSKKLSLGIRLLATSLGHHVSFAPYHRKEGQIEGRKIKAYTLWTVRWERNKSQREGIFIGDHSWLTLKDKQEGRKSVRVYNFSVEEDESYVADGIVVHNCTNHSLAKGTKRKHQGQMDLFKSGKLDARAERSRATMWDVPRFAEYHNYNIIIVENVVDARRWRMWDAWLMAMHSLDYKHKCVFINSMHCHPTPQSRDRMYVVFWKKGNPQPDLNFRPTAYCPTCHKDLEAYQSWKNGQKKWGKFGDRQQYVYRCSGCTGIVQPYYYAAFNAINWRHPIQRIGDRKKPLAQATENRIKKGLEKFGGEFFTVTSGYSSGIDCRIKNLYEFVLPTQPGDARHGVALPFFIKGEHSKAGTLLKNGNEALHTQTTRQTMSVVVPFIIGNYTPGWQRESTKPLGTVTCQDHHGVVIPKPLIIEGFGGSTARTVTERLGCMTTKDKYGLLTTRAWNSFIASYYGNGDNVKHSCTSSLPTVTTKDRNALIQIGQESKYEDFYYRMLKPDEVKKAMAFHDDYIVVGNSRDKVKQLGNAVTPPVMEWLVDRCISTLN